jgi:acyl-[acyl carrier protein]--UDP-N-acetylglucosamine O-acyltransferase
VRALNKIGLDRAGLPAASRSALKRAFRMIFRGTSPRASAALALSADPDPYVRELSAFLREQA